MEQEQNAVTSTIQFQPEEIARISRYIRIGMIRDLHTTSL